MYFSEVIGLEEVKKRLIITANDNRISHAQLFLGPEGSGKLALALAYAQFIACEDKQEQDSCGKCHSCNKYNKLIHPDLHFVYPVAKTKKFTNPKSDDFLSEWRKFVLDSPYHTLNAWLDFIGTENAQGSIYAHESQEIIRKLNMKTFEAEYKIMIIWMPEKMNISAANKLLKMIEEPPQKTLFILVSENEEEIIATIRSRVQLIKVSKIDKISMFNSLKSKFNLPDAEINNVVKLANGNYVNAVNILKARNKSLFQDTVVDDSSVIFFGLFSKMMRICYTANVPEIILWVNEMADLGREKQKNYLIYALRMLRENFILNLVPEKSDELVFLANEEADFSKKFSAFIHKKNIFFLYEEIDKAYQHIERNANDKILFLDMGLKLSKMLRIPAA